MAYTNIDDPSAHFQTALYTGNATNGKTVTNDGNSDLQPDWVWVKNRSGTANHNCSDSSRGATKHLAQNITYQEEIVSGITGYNSDGFTLGTNGDSNGNGASFVAWQWKANGGTTASNTDGTITSTVQVNQDAGFSIVTYTAPSGAGNFTAGHGLGVKPDMVITKSRGATGGWWIWHKDLGQPNYYIGLHSSGAQAFEANMWGAGFDTSTIGLNVAASAQASQTYVAYCFAEKQGYSKFGSYVGTANANGPFVYTGFKPAWLMVKNSANSGWDWAIMDNKRTPTNANGTYEWIWANLNSAEFTDGDSGINMEIDFLSNGFKIRTARDELTRNGDKFIYMCFAENPFVTSTGIPTTAR